MRRVLRSIRRLIASIWIEWAKVVGEVDHHAQACEEQEDSAADGEPRVVLCPGAGCQADSEPGQPRYRQRSP